MKPSKSKNLILGSKHCSLILNYIFMSIDFQIMLWRYVENRFVKFTRDQFYDFPKEEKENI